MTSGQRGAAGSITWDPEPVHRREPVARGEGPNPCFHCLNGNPNKCTAVGCWRCACGCRLRRHGMVGDAPALRHDSSGVTFSTIAGTL